MNSMYVNPFIFGIVCTIGVEILIALIAISIIAFKVYKEDKETKEKEKEANRGRR